MKIQSTALIILTLLSANAQNQCITLSAKSVCGPEFEGMPVMFPSESDFNSSQLNLVSPKQVASSFNQTFGCLSDAPIESSLRFQLSWWCSYSVQTAISSGCSVKSSTYPDGPLLCYNECIVATNSIADVFANASLCIAGQKTTARNSAKSTFLQLCNTSNTTLATSKNQCYKGAAQESLNAGWYNREDALLQCKNLQKDALCSRFLNPNSSSSGLSATVIGIIIGVIVLFLIVLALYFWYRNRDAKNTSFSFKSPKNNQGRSSDMIVTERDLKTRSSAFSVINKSIENGNKILTVVHEYEATMPDELLLRVGDQVELLKEFDDGWALGKHMETYQEGVFPIVCTEQSENDHTRLTIISDFAPNNGVYVSSKTESAVWDNKSNNPSFIFNKRISSVALTNDARSSKLDSPITNPFRGSS